MNQNKRRVGYHSVNSRQRKSRAGRLVKVLLLVLIVGGVIFGFMLHDKSKSANTASVVAVSSKSTLKPTKTATAATTDQNTTTTTNTEENVSTQTASNPCASNTLSQLLYVSISDRHMWACEGSTSVFDSPVITGMSFLAADLTPPGTYHIYSKLTNQVLRGSDSTGSWNDPVSYWMPFLDNQYGQYGFHDATWRPDNAFGNVSPDSPNASHGCVETPLATARWIYNWAPVGTTVTIVS